jgi:hypothetical protein
MREKSHHRACAASAIEPGRLDRIDGDFRRGEALFAFWIGLNMMTVTP